MQTIQKGNYPGKSSIYFHPMIDMDPTGMNCIYSTLCLVTLQGFNAKCKNKWSPDIWSWFDRDLASDLANVYAFIFGNEQCNVIVDIRLVCNK